MTIQYETIAVGRMTGGELPVEKYSKADGFAAARGQWVRLNTNGKIERISAVASLGVLGILAAAATSAASDVSNGTPVILAEPDVVFEAQVWHTTTASAVTSNTMQSKSYAAKLSATTTIDALDIETGADAQDFATIVSLSKKDERGAQHGRVQFKVTSTAYQLSRNTAH